MLIKRNFPLGVGRYPLVKISRNSNPLRLLRKSNGIRFGETKSSFSLKN
jgi:hypothetical protein